MHITSYVISDLHLGGAPGGVGRLGFQICPPRTLALLVTLIHRLPGRVPNTDVRLVIAGDIVDFLAEEPFQAFTSDPEAAHAKLGQILDSTAQVGTHCNISSPNAMVR